MKLFDDLLYRGLIQDVSDKSLEEKLNNGGMTFYWGTDPSGESLHIGHYVSLLIAERLRRAGHHPILLVGGATGLVGDPRPNSERPMITKELLNFNYESIKKQINSLFKFDMVNNYDWSKEINFIDYLRDYGKYFSVNYMLNKDTVKSRLDIGITYTEFSYMIMQSLDFLYLFEHNNCTMQIGGSDQWGNITSGIELIRKKTNKEAYGFTTPLMLKADGTKFGKSEGKAIWLDINKTSAYEMYQFFINSEDEKVIEYLKKLTFLTKEEIDVFEIKQKEHPEKREAAKMLAKEVITFLHKDEEYQKAIKISEILFDGNIKELTKEELNEAFKNFNSYDINTNINIVELLVKAGIATSNRDARELILNNSIKINGDIVNNIDEIITKDKALNDLIIIRKGKKKYFVIKYI
ncbi:MAG: tyrosine--tRNA ligase [Bacilli bacterium]